MSFLFVDPGLNTGWATFTEIGLPTGRGIVRGVDKFVEWLNKQEPHRMIGYEDFHLFGHKAVAQTGSKMEASQVIGVLKMKKGEWDAKLVPYRPGTYRTGMQFAGQKIPKSHIADDLSAYYLGIYFLTTSGILTSQGRTVITRDSLLTAHPEHKRK